MIAPTKTDLPIYLAHRVVSAKQGGSSRPVVIESDAGYFFTKLFTTASSSLGMSSGLFS